MQTILKSGTLTDRVSALSLAIQESPIHNCRFLDILLNMAKKKSRREAVLAVDAMKDLMLGTGEGKICRFFFLFNSSIGLML
jgi:ribosome biogenesis protein MAK21